jgi:hypothetical protein
LLTDQAGTPEEPGGDTFKKIHKVARFLLTGVTWLGMISMMIVMVRSE